MHKELLWSRNGSRRSEFTLGWKPLVAATLGVACGGSPVPFNVLPLAMGPIHAELGWDFTSISAGMTIYGVIASLLAPLFGGLADRFGVRPVALFSLAAFALTFAAFYYVPNSLTGYWTLWAVLGAIAIGSTPVTFSRGVSVWFYRHRGLALAIMLAGTSVAALTVPQLAQSVIASGGWRLAFPVAALLPLLIALPVGILWFREPRAEERPAGVADAHGRLMGMTLAQALQGYRFWLLLVCVSLVAFAYAGAHIHIVQIAQKHGLSPRTAAGLLGVVALGILAGRLGVGFLFDRIWAPAVAFPALLLPAVACWFLIGTSTNLPLILSAVFLLGCAAGAESDIIAYLTARYFGMAHYGRIYGTQYMAFGVAASLSLIAYGIARDRTGGYDQILMLAMVLFATAGLLLLLLGRYPTADPAASAPEPAVAH